jgi:hypothetical protein
MDVLADIQSDLKAYQKNSSKILDRSVEEISIYVELLTQSKQKCENLTAKDKSKISKKFNGSKEATDIAIGAFIEVYNYLIYTANLEKRVKLLERTLADIKK